MPLRQARAQWARKVSRKGIRALLAEARRERESRKDERDGAVDSEEARERQKLSRGRKERAQKKRRAKAVTGRLWRGIGRQPTAMGAN